VKNVGNKMAERTSHWDLERIIWKINVRNNETESRKSVGMEKLDTKDPPYSRILKDNG